MQSPYTTSDDILDAIEQQISNININKPSSSSPSSSLSPQEPNVPDMDMIESILNPLPSKIKTCTISVNDKYYPLVVYQIKGSMLEKDVLDLKEKIIQLFINANDYKLSLVFDLKKVNYIHLKSIIDLYNALTLYDPDFSSLLLNNVINICFLIPSTPERKEVVSILKMAFAEFPDLVKQDQRYKQIRYKYVQHNHDVDAFLNRK